MDRGVNGYNPPAACAILARKRGSGPRPRKEITPVRLAHPLTGGPLRDGRLAYDAGLGAAAVTQTHCANVSSPPLHLAADRSIHRLRLGHRTRPAEARRLPAATIHLRRRDAFLLHRERLSSHL